LESRAIYPRHRAHSAADRSAVSQPTSAQHSQQLFSVPAALRPTAPGAVAGDAPVRLGGSKLALLLVSFKTAALRVASLRSLPHEAAFKQLCRGELDVVASARPMTRAALAECAAASSEFIELPLAYAGVVVLENYDNVWADPLRAETLTGLIGNAQTAPARLWSDLGKYWPEVDARLYVLRETRGLGELFEELFGEPGRNLLTNEIGLRRSEAELLRAVREDPYAIALLPMGYYLENEAHLPTFTRGTRVVDAFGNAVRPSAQSIASRYYLPLSRLLFLYVNAAAANRPAVQGFVRSALEPQAEWISQSVFFGLEPEQYQQALHKFAERRVGSIFGRDQLDGLTAGEILRGRAFPRPY
jgi:phosphate transport system substrate-binding protein